VSGELMAATRDASWWNHPDVTAVKQVHVAIIGGQDGSIWTAACNRTLPLDDNGGWRAADVPYGLRCLRPGCRKRWPGVTRDYQH
jgi:hypothetical protein